MKWSEAQIEETIKTFKPYADQAGESFTREDAIESLNNITAFCEYLMELDRELCRREMPSLISVLSQIRFQKINRASRCHASE